MKPSDAPCHGCPDRAIGCHGRCDAYKAFREEREAVYQDQQLKQKGSPDIPTKKKQKRMIEQAQIQRKGYLK